MENYLATASSNKELDKHALCVHYCLTFISSMSYQRSTGRYTGRSQSGRGADTSDSICRWL